MLFLSIGELISLICFPSFKHFRSSVKENNGREGRHYSCSTIMADSILVSQNTATTCGLSQASTSTEDSIDTTVGQEQNTTTSAKTSSDSLQIIRQSFQSRGLSNDFIEIIMQSWRESTLKQYWSHIQKWLCFCAERQINSMSPTVNSVLEFLARLFHSGIGYSGLNTARSALSTFVSIDGVVSLGINMI